MRISTVAVRLAVCMPAMCAMLAGLTTTAAIAQNSPPSASELKSYPAPTPGSYPKPPADYSTDKGIWKSFVPKNVHGQFDDYDPVGLMAGALIKADCSINWRNPNTGKLYCFASGTSLVYFERFPEKYIRKARKEYGKLKDSKKPAS